MTKSRQEASRLLNEKAEKRAVMEKNPKSQPIIEQQTKKKKSKGMGAY